MKAGGSDDPEKDKHDEGKGSHGEVGDQVNREKLSTDVALKEGREDKDLNPDGETGDQFHTNRAEQHPSVLCITQGQVDRIEPPNDPTAISPSAQAEVFDHRKAELTDILVKAETEYHASAIQPDAWSGLHRFYTKGSVLTTITPDMQRMGAQGLFEEWNAKRQGPVLEKKITWALKAGLEIREDIGTDYVTVQIKLRDAAMAHEPQDGISRKETFKAAVNEWARQEIPESWRPVIDVWYEQIVMQNALAEAAAQEEEQRKEEKRKKKEKKEKRKRKDAKDDEGKDDEEMLIQKLETSETATTDGAITGGSGAGTCTSGKIRLAKGFAYIAAAGPRANSVTFTAPDPEHICQANRRTGG